VLTGRGLCDELIIRPEESFRLWCVVVCDLETTWMRKPGPTGGCCVKSKYSMYVRSRRCALAAFYHQGRSCRYPSDTTLRRFYGQYSLRGKHANKLILRI